MPNITFAALPARAIGDDRLKGSHLKVLAAIAIHDRLSGARGKGQGCWAGNKRLAGMIGCNYTRLSATITDLATSAKVPMCGLPDGPKPAWKMTGASSAMPFRLIFFASWNGQDEGPFANLFLRFDGSG